jgi:hypothetical protein
MPDTGEDAAEAARRRLARRKGRAATLFTGGDDLLGTGTIDKKTALG